MKKIFIQCRKQGQEMQRTVLDQGLQCIYVLEKCFTFLSNLVEEAHKLSTIELQLGPW